MSFCKEIHMNFGRLKSVTLIATLALAFPVPAALAQTSDFGAKQDMKNAGHESKNAAKDAGHGAKQGTKKAYHSTKRDTKKAWHKTKDTTKGAANGAKEGARQPE